MKDEDIICLFFQRNEDAIFQTQKKYGSYCFVVANTILRNQENSEECLNDTWLETWNAIPPQKPNALKLFVAKITRNLALDKYRKQHALKRGRGEIPLILDELQEKANFTFEVARCNSKNKKNMAWMQTLLSIEN
ncbi:MAG: hypothetical protein GX361_07250 [Bacteroidales bacterium]|nr:hypothetical protein [Bacteroidales bacterium]